ncbi:MAG: hypothetical protein ACK4MF_04430 [Hyphomicrobiaceae bacterium]
MSLRMSVREVLLDLAPHGSFSFEAFARSGRFARSATPSTLGIGDLQWAVTWGFHDPGVGRVGRAALAAGLSPFLARRRRQSSMQRFIVAAPEGLAPKPLALMSTSAGKAAAPCSRWRSFDSRRCPVARNTSLTSMTER